MKPEIARNKMSAEERHLRSRAAQLLDGAGLLHGTLVERHNAAASPTATAPRGRHRALVLTVRPRGNRSRSTSRATSRPRCGGGWSRTTRSGTCSQSWPCCTRRRSASSRPGGLILRRILTYAEKVCGLVTGLGGLVDSGSAPTSPPATSPSRSSSCSSHAWAASTPSSRLRHPSPVAARPRREGRSLPSADTLARVQALFDPGDIRGLHRPALHPPQAEQGPAAPASRPDRPGARWARIHRQLPALLPWLPLA